MAARSATSTRRFYQEALTEAERLDFPVALELDGVDEEIAVLRLRLRAALKEHPEDMRLMVQGMTLLVRALAAKYRLSKGDEEALAAATGDEIEGDVWLRSETKEGAGGDQRND